MLVNVLLVAVLVVLLAAGVLLWRVARRTEDAMDFQQSEGMDKADDSLRLGIALSSNSNLLGGH